MHLFVLIEMSKNINMLARIAEPSVAFGRINTDMSGTEAESGFGLIAESMNRILFTDLYLFNSDSLQMVTEHFVSLLLTVVNDSISIARISLETRKRLFHILY